MDEKKPLEKLFRESPETKEGKYLVKRRDGTVVEWPLFVLGAKDPIGIGAMRWYGNEVLRLIREEPEQAALLSLTVGFGESCVRQADAWEQYRKVHGTGDPGMGRHRKDDPATIAEMRKGQGA